MSGVEVSAIVVNFNGGDLLARCLTALSAAAGTRTVETIVVDNGSKDGSVDAVSDAVRPTVLIPVERNLGFAKAVALATARASGRYWLFLNSDCFLTSHALETLVRRLDSDEAAAVVGPRLVNLDGSLQRSCHDFPTPAVFFLEQSSLWRLLAGRRWAHWPSLASAHDQLRSVDWLSGACWLVRPAAWRALGGFDPGFFFYFEETDLCFRLRQRGWRIWFEPAAEAVHVGGGSSDAAALLGQYFTGLYRFYRKHYSRPALALVRGMVACMATFKALRAALSACARPDETARRRAQTTARAWADVVRF